MGKLLVTALLVLSGSTALAQENAPAGSADRGYQVNKKVQSYTCHGTVGLGAARGTGPKLAPNPISYASFERQLRIPRQDMPAYRKAFVTDQEVADMYSYLVSIQPSPVVKDIPLLEFAERPPQ
jgi:hypothetical protein